ncbi:hypothetical protein Sjap_007313 [Stephania japonica]|uniref:Fungal lipase-type domain-containing protein n=1 Tax=Stephania japonica TaxID=461633 RepID=A0AAP0PB75_9MAGN
MDGIYFKAGIQRLSWPISFGGNGAHPAQVSAVGRSSSVNTNASAINGVSVETSSSSSAAPPQTTLSSRFSFNFPFRSIWATGDSGSSSIRPDDNAAEGEGLKQEDESIGVVGREETENESWVLKILKVRTLWGEKGRVGVDGLEGEEGEEERNGGDGDDGEGNGCEGCVVDGEEERVEFDRDSFSRLLKRVSLADSRFYARMSHLGNLAYDVTKIKPQNLLKDHGLQYVTSSVEKKAQSVHGEKNVGSSQVHENENKTDQETAQDEQQKKSQYQISASAAYNIAASAASYVQSHTRSILSFKASKDRVDGNLLEESNEVHEDEVPGPEVASFVATTNSVTAVVAAKEETRQAVAKELNSASSSPCEWFICDDEQTQTRFFVIQGSESLASWQANLLFEPIQFEGLDALVHRGIYEAAKGIYKQMLPEVRAHLKSHGDLATLCFTGHSLGGSLSLLINLMLLIRGEVPRSSLLPVVMFGAPSIMCGGDLLLCRLGLPLSHVRAITMHRDIVPRAFSCDYPDHVAEFLKAINGNFRNLPCLANQKRLYSPMGEVLILQPEEKLSPHHHLLPFGAGLYTLCVPTSDSANQEKLLQGALAAFFNSPHPLEILSDRSAYGSDGTIYRDHDMNSYLKSVLGVIRIELNQMRKAKRECRREAWWPLISPEGIHDKINISKQVLLSNSTPSNLSVSGIFQIGKRSMKRLSSVVASQHQNLLVLLLFPTHLLVLGAWTAISLK